MRDPYENILIGNFLYSLGLIIGKLSPDMSPPGIVNLLQQTPLDSQMADVYLGYPGVVRLIEFKRASNKSKKESIRRECLEEALTGQPDLMKVSRGIHWYVETTEAIRSELDWTTNVCPYIDFEKADRVNTSFDTFMNSLANSALNSRSPEYSEEQIAAYLVAVGTFAGKESSSSGLLVSVDAEGALRYIAVDDIRDLANDLRRYIERNLGQERELNQEREIVRDMSMGR